MGSVSEGLGSVSEGLVPITVPARVQVPQGKITEGPEGPGLARSDLQPMNNCYNQSLFDRLIKHCEIIWSHHGYSYRNQLSRCNMFSFYIPPALRPLQWFFSLQLFGAWLHGMPQPRRHQVVTAKQCFLALRAVTCKKVAKKSPLQTRNVALQRCH